MTYNVWTHMYVPTYVLTYLHTNSYSVRTISLELVDDSAVSFGGLKLGRRTSAMASQLEKEREEERCMAPHNLHIVFEGGDHSLLPYLYIAEFAKHN